MTAKLAFVAAPAAPRDDQGLLGEVRMKRKVPRKAGPGITRSDRQFFQWVRNRAQSPSFAPR
jgi:hypothetical protein